jgi:prepilin-type N-terminal cleavage/methylation domain-containing protein
MSKGFTLIELLVAIAILATLAVTVILVVNPAQLLKEAREKDAANQSQTFKHGEGR